MATYSRHKKARMLRDVMIESNMVHLFKEDEVQETIIFRTSYPMQGDHRQVVINIDDTAYTGVQSLLAQDVPADKQAEVLKCINQFNMQFPTLKYVLTNDHNIITSMFFNGDEKSFDAHFILGTTIQMMKNISEKQYTELKQVLGI